MDLKYWALQLQCSGSLAAPNDESVELLGLAVDV